MALACNVVICSLNWLALGRPRRCDCAVVFHGDPNKSQIDLQNQIRSSMLDLCRLPDLPVSGGLATLTQLLDLLDLDAYSNSYGSGAGPLHVHAGNVALPHLAAAVELDETGAQR